MKLESFIDPIQLALVFQLDLPLSEVEAANFDEFDILLLEEVRDGFKDSKTPIADALGGLAIIARRIEEK